MIIHLGADHAGFELKEKLKIFLAELGYEIKDHGAFILDDNDDYPDFIWPAARAVAANPDTDKGVLLGGSGQGEAMVANRLKGARAVVFYGGDDWKDIIRLSREHNNANILSFGARFVDEQRAKDAVKLWLDTAFKGEERHVRRLKKIDG